MKKVFSILAAATMLAACTIKHSNTKDMNPLSFTTEQAACMSAIACNEAKGDLVALESAIHNGLETGLTVSQIKEALSQLYAYTGFPRSLNALGVLQNVVESRKSKDKRVIMGEDASPLSDELEPVNDDQYNKVK